MRSFNSTHAIAAPAAPARPAHPEARRTIGTAVLALLITLYILGGRWNFIRLVDVTISMKEWPERKTLNLDVLPYEIRPMTLILAFALLSVLGMRRIEPRVWGVLWPILVYLAWFIASALWTPLGANYPGKLVDITYLFLGLVCVGYAISARINFIKYFLLTMMAALSILAFIGLKDYLFGGGQDVPELEGLADETRLSILGGGPNVFARNMGVLFILAVARFLSGPKIVEAVGVAGLALLALALAVLTGSRGALVATVVAIPILLLGFGVSARAIGCAALVALPVAIVAGSVLSDSLLSNEFIQKRWIEETFLTGYVSNRDHLAEVALDLWLSSPIIGTGLNSFAELNDWEGLYAHNLILETAQETGIVGVILLAFVARQFWRRMDLKSSKASATLVTLTFLWFVGTMSSGDLYDSRNVFIFGLLSVHAAGRRGEGAERLAAVLDIPRG